MSRPPPAPARANAIDEELRLAGALFVAQLVLQWPLAEGLRPYDRLVAVLLIVVAAGLALALIGAFWFSPK